MALRLLAIPLLLALEVTYGLALWVHFQVWAQTHNGPLGAAPLALLQWLLSEYLHWPL